MSPAYDDLASVTEELYDKVHAVNAKGPFRLSVLVGTRMAAADGGSIINVSSVGSWRPTPMDPLWDGQSRGQRAHPRARGSLGSEGAGQPGAPERHRDGPHRGMATRDQVSHRRHQPDEAPRLSRGLRRRLRFLASEAAGYINGAQVPVDGGMYRTL